MLQNQWPGHNSELVLLTTPSHVSIPLNQKGTLAKGGFSESAKYIGNLQPCEWCCVLARVFSRGARLFVSACGRLGVANAQAHLIGRWGVTVWMVKARLSMRVPFEMSKPLACMRGWLIARERAVGCPLGYYKHNIHPSVDVLTAANKVRGMLHLIKK